MNDPQAQYTLLNSTLFRFTRSELQERLDFLISYAPNRRVWGGANGAVIADEIDRVNAILKSQPTKFSLTASVTYSVPNETASLAKAMQVLDQLDELGEHEANVYEVWFDEGLRLNIGAENAAQLTYATNIIGVALLSAGLLPDAPAQLGGSQLNDGWENLDDHSALFWQNGLMVGTIHTYPPEDAHHYPWTSIAYNETHEWGTRQEAMAAVELLATDPQKRGLGMQLEPLVDQVVGGC